MLAGLADQFWEHGKRLRPLEVVAEYENTIIDELDLMHVSGVGRFGRMWMAGTESDIIAARDAAVAAIAAIDGVEE